VGIVITEDGDAGEMRANRHALKLMGHTASGAPLLTLPKPLPLTVKGIPIEAEDQPLVKAMQSGASVPPYEARIETPGESSVDVMVWANPLFDDTGKVRGAIAVLVDISSQKEAERRQDRLLHELQHRVKNILATIAAMTSQTMDSSSNIEDFAVSFQDRVYALARIHELLSSFNWEGADLGALITTILSPYAARDSHNLHLIGPEFRLNSSAASTLGMILFELASNAAKYGSLSTDKGSVSVAWELEPANTLSIKWEETGGPPITTTPEKSFGTTFISQGLEYELGGKAALKFNRSGLHCDLAVPVEKIAVRK
jgi:two-component system CheB/CheR fusion protein